MSFQEIKDSLPDTSNFGCDLEWLGVLLDEMGSIGMHICASSGALVQELKICVEGT